MKIETGKGTSIYGPGVAIYLEGNEITKAIDAYWVANRVTVIGPRTITVNKELCQEGFVYVDPSGWVIHEGKKYSGRGPDSSS